MSVPEVVNSIDLTANELSLIAGIIITALFYQQYKKYSVELEREEILEQFLSSSSSL
jgi:hypothetical protein